MLVKMGGTVTLQLHSWFPTPKISRRKKGWPAVDLTIENEDPNDGGGRIANQHKKFIEVLDFMKDRKKPILQNQGRGDNSGGIRAAFG